MSRYTVECDGKTYRLLRYQNFEALGLRAQPSAPTIAVPLLDNVEAAVEQAKHLERDLEHMLVKLHLPGAATSDSVRYEDKLNFPFRFFRGESSVRYGIMPTRYRFSGQPDPDALTRQRIEFEARCAEQMQTYLSAHGAPNASNEQARAAARHHGCPSSFVDFSFTPEVAAFFAHPPFSQKERTGPGTRPIGTLYSLGVDVFERTFGGMCAWGIPPQGGRDLNYINHLHTWQIEYLGYDEATRRTTPMVLSLPVPQQLIVRAISIRTRIVPAIERIKAQRGLFIDSLDDLPNDWWCQVYLWTLLDFASTKWCFYRGDYQYENPAQGITSAALFPPMSDELKQATAHFTDCP